MDTQKTALVSSNADKIPMSLFPFEVVGSLCRNKNHNRRSHFAVHPHYKGVSGCKQTPKCIHTHQFPLPTWTRPVPLSLGSLSPSSDVRQIRALCTFAKGAKTTAPLATKCNLHLQGHSQPAASISPLALSPSLVAGVTVPPAHI